MNTVNNTVYMLQIGMDSSQKTGIPSYLYETKSKAISLTSWYNEGFIPISALIREKKDFILHWPFGCPNNCSRIDAHKFTSPEWNDSIGKLILYASGKGANVTVYLGTVQDCPDSESALEGLNFIAEQAIYHRCNVIIDAAASAIPAPMTKYSRGAEAYLAALEAFADKLHRGGLKFGVEGMWSPVLHEVLNKKTDMHFVEFGTVVNSYETPDNPGWKDIVKPDVSKVLMWASGSHWNQHVKDTFTQASINLVDGLSYLNIGGYSAIGAHDWFFDGQNGSPKIVISGGNQDCQKALGISQILTTERVRLI